MITVFLQFLIFVTKVGYHFTKPMYYTRMWDIDIHFRIVHDYINYIIMYLQVTSDWLGLEYISFFEVFGAGDHILWLEEVRLSSPSFDNLSCA